MTDPDEGIELYVCRACGWLGQRPAHLLCPTCIMRGVNGSKVESTGPAERYRISEGR